MENNASLFIKNKQLNRSLYQSDKNEKYFLYIHST